MKTAVVIQAGGVGTRLWPLSTQNLPKQFSKLVDGKSLLRSTFERIHKQYDHSDIFITSNIRFKDLILKEIPELSENNLILEPKKMDTTAIIGLTSFKMKSMGYETVISVACDHYIKDVNEFLKILKIAGQANEKYRDNLILIGMNPTYPSTGFGYIEMSAPVDRIDGETIFSVNTFKEKPDLKTAEKFISDWKYLWNASYFIFNPEFLLEKYKLLVENTYNILEKCFSLDPHSNEFLELFSKCDAIPFDYSILEKLDNTFVIPANVGWSDIGSWKAIHDMFSNDEIDQNISIGNSKFVNSEGSLIYSPGSDKLIAVLGLNNIIVINTPDVTFITNRENSENVKKMVDEVEDKLK